MYHLKIAALAASAGALALGAVAGSAVAADKVTWNHSIWGNPRAYTVGIEAVADYVEEKSGGNFVVRIHYGETISPVKENLDGLQIGAFESASICTGYHPGKNQAATGLDLPFLPLPTFQMQQQVSEAYYQHPAVKDEMKRWGAQYAFRGLLPQSEFMGGGEPPRELEDWKSMRMRALGGTGQAMKELGAVPTSVPAPEVYTGIERGMFQAAAFPFSYAHGAYKIHEVSKWYTYNMAPGSNHCPALHSIAALEALPAEYRELLEEAKPIAYEALIKGYEEADAKWIPIFDETGLERITYSDEQLAEFRRVGAKPVWEAWVKDMDSKGIPGQELLDLILAEAEKAAS